MSVKSVNTLSTLLTSALVVSVFMAGAPNSFARGLPPAPTTPKISSYAQSEFLEMIEKRPNPFVQNKLIEEYAAQKGAGLSWSDLLTLVRALKNSTGKFNDHYYDRENVSERMLRQSWRDPNVEISAYEAIELARYQEKLDRRNLLIEGYFTARQSRLTQSQKQGLIDALADNDLSNTFARMLGGLHRVPVTQALKIVAQIESEEEANKFLYDYFQSNRDNLTGQARRTIISRLRKLSGEMSGAWFDKGNIAREIENTR